MSKAAFDKIAEGLQEALAVAKGEADPHRVRKVPVNSQEPTAPPPPAP